MAAAEIAQRLGVGSSHVHTIIRNADDFPEPIDELRVGKIYSAEDVEAWIAARKAKAEERAR